MKIDIDLFKKETDRNRYLLPESCHPKQTTKSIPFSLAMRIVRICTNKNVRDWRLKQLKHLLLARNYVERSIEAAINKARAIPRHKALRKLNRPRTSEIPVFAVQFDPRLPSISQIQSKHWRAMTSNDQYLAECFKKPPLIALKKNKKKREHLIRATVPPNERQQRNFKGMFKCGQI